MLIVYDAFYFKSMQLIRQQLPVIVSLWCLMHNWPIIFVITYALTLNNIHAKPFILTQYAWYD